MEGYKKALNGPMQSIVKFLRDGIHLAYSLTGRNVSDFDKKNVKAFSPRFLSVVPEEEDTNSQVMSSKILKY